MTARPTAAAATWPYPHPTMEEVEGIYEMSHGGHFMQAAELRRTCVARASIALTHSQGGAPRNRRAEEAGAPTPASNFAGVA